jgi:DNA repair and recombination protein RAD54B
MNVRRNPAMDAQAMARVWREGQSHPGHVYRLITTGCMEEKVYQRQRAKGDVAAATVGVDAGNNKASTSKVRAGQRGQFSRDELRQLFTVRTDTRCDTADMLAAAGETFEDCSGAQDLDPPLVAAVAAGHISFVHVERRKGQRAAQPLDHLHEEAVAAKEMPMTAATQHQGEDVMMVGCGDASELDVEDSMA